MTDDWESSSVVFFRVSGGRVPPVGVDFGLKMGVGSSIRLGMRIGNPHFWAKKRGVEVETSTNMQKLDEML
jgi:hypothetical protein